MVRVKGQVRRFLYYINLFFEYWGRYLLLALPKIMKGRIVLLDRSIHDMHVGYKNQSLKNYRLFRRFLIHCMPTPTFVVVLLNDSSVIWQRKKEDSLEDNWKKNRTKKVQIEPESLLFQNEFDEVFVEYQYG